MRALLTIAALLVAGLVASPAAIAAHGHPGRGLVAGHGHLGPHGVPGRYVPVHPHHGVYRYPLRYPPVPPRAYPHYRYHAPVYPGCSPYGIYGRTGFGYQNSRFSLYLGF